MRKRSWGEYVGLLLAAVALGAVVGLVLSR